VGHDGCPLVTGNDLRKMSPQTKEILANKEVLTIDQNKLGVQGYRYAAKDNLETWLKPLADGKWAVGFLNCSGKPQPISFNCRTIPITDELSKAALNANKPPTGSGISERTKTWALPKKAFTATVPSHDVVVLLLNE
jgi:alpha-galactosidase